MCHRHFLWVTLTCFNPRISAVTSSGIGTLTLVGTLYLDSRTCSFSPVPLNSKLGRGSERHVLVQLSGSQSKLPTGEKSKL